MGLFGFFKKKKVRKKSRRKSVSNKSQAYNAKFDKIEAEIKTIHLLLQNHDQSITQHSQILEEHTQKLEDLIDQPGTNQPEISENNSIVPSLPIKDPVTKKPTIEKSDKLNLDSLSGQERNILNVFFQHPDMALSYSDIGTFLGKSPNTIKNQLRQLRIKADLFSKSADADNRNRFKLKYHLRVEKYLNLPDSSTD
jgi:DNA-binding CsgD family transcriptional regulator